MGVRGLTSYIAKNAEKYLEPYELHDCNLVIDGDSLSSNLYRWHSQCNSAFGGDYDQYYRTVVHFFDTLKQCNITAYVLLDGGYQSKKLRTVKHRLRSKIACVKHINPFDASGLFPLMMREVFVDATKACGIPVMRCVHEADDEVAILARRLNCPVLSYDSDFYIHNVMYIPSITLTLKVHKKKSPKKPSKRLTFKPYSFLDCCMYKIEHLAKGQINDDLLPLFASLLGNDYINRSFFRKFYTNISLKGCGKHNSQQQRRIIALLKWLQHETLNSAMKKILGRIEAEKRDFILQQIEESMSGYNRQTSQALEFFNLENYEMQKPSNSNMEIDSSDESDDEDSDFSEDSSSSYAIDSESDLNRTSDKEQLNEDEQQEDEEEEEETEDIEPETSNQNEPMEVYQPSEWILKLINNAEVPRFVVDLLHLRLYVNSPQVENFEFPDSNEIALPILNYIFTLLWYPETQSFQYLTRLKRIGDVRTKQFNSIELNTEFNSNIANNKLQFHEIFKNFPNCNSFLERNTELSVDLQLYLLAIIYWANRSEYVDRIHVHSLIICLCVLHEADRKIVPVTRDPRVFTKRYGNLINSKQSATHKADNAKEDVEDSNDQQDAAIMEVQNSSKSIEKIRTSLTKKDSIYLEWNVIQMFQISDKIRQKHTEFSSTIIHVFAEFQATVFNMNCLNAILNSPYQTIQISTFFNGTFLYNLYNLLKDRPNISHYAKYHLFRRCSNYTDFYEAILEYVDPYLTCMVKETQLKRKQLRNQKKRLKRKRLAEMNKKSLKELGVAAKPQPCIFFNVDKSESIESEFEDINNQFSKLTQCP